MYAQDTEYCVMAFSPWQYGTEWLGAVWTRTFKDMGYLSGRNIVSCPQEKNVPMYDIGDEEHNRPGRQTNYGINRILGLYPGHATNPPPSKFTTIATYRYVNNLVVFADGSAPAAALNAAAKAAASKENQAVIYFNPINKSSSRQYGMPVDGTNRIYLRHQNAANVYLFSGAVLSMKNNDLNSKITDYIYKYFSPTMTSQNLLSEHI